VKGILATTLVEAELGCTEQLARFFADVRSASVQALLTLSRPGSVVVREAIVIEFASAEKAIFTSRLPLEFDDRLHLEDDRGCGVEGQVIAVQYHDGKTAVAVEFLNGPFFWVKRP
jgi:hypothetical protein